MTEEKKKNLQASTFEELIDAEYGPIGTPERDKWELESDKFVVSEL